MTVRPEFELLQKTACPDLVDNSDRVLELLQQGIDWDELPDMVRLHGTEAPLASVLEKHPDLVPKEFLEKLHGYVRKNEEFNRALTDMLFDLLPQFEELGVRVVPFKGPEMSMAIYGSLDQRPFHDVDLFVDPPGARAVIDQLMGQGYTLKHGGVWDESEFRWTHGETLKAPGTLYEVDVHWDIMSYRSFGCRFPFGELWERRTTVKLVDREVPCLSLEDIFLILCVHGCKHRWILLQWIRDIAALTNLDYEMDWKAVKHRASEMGALRMVALSLDVVQRVLGVGLPEAVLREFPPDRIARSLGEEITTYLAAEMEFAPPGRLRHEFYLRMRERLRDKIRFSVYLAKRGTDRTRWHVPQTALISLLFNVAWPIWSFGKRSARLFAQFRSGSARS